MDIFKEKTKELAFKNAPLAERMRPLNLSEIIGQDEATGRDSFVGKAVLSGRIFSMIFWGPPGCGKTTLARVIAAECQSDFLEISAVGSGVKQIREAAEKAKENLAWHSRKTTVFVDEIHRFNKAQQDAFLPHVESGILTLIGATTENPSFEVISPLLSRCRVIVLKPISADDLLKIMENALSDSKKGLGNLKIKAEPDALKIIAEASDGDARRALNALEAAAFLALPEGEKLTRIITAHSALEALQKRGLIYDKSGEEHYNLISALHKSLRDSDPDGAIYWLARILFSGEDPLYPARRMVRFATEDIGMADPNALYMAMSAVDSFRFLGSPEGELALYQLAVYLATAPKSNSIYMAEKNLKKTIEKTGSLPVPMHIRNAPTRLMKDLGYSKGYQYAHDNENALVDQEHLPEEIKGEQFYYPASRGFEKTIKARLEKWREFLKKMSKKDM